jgi:hypothetical protein
MKLLHHESAISPRATDAPTQGDPRAIEWAAISNPCHPPALRIRFPRGGRCRRAFRAKTHQRRFLSHGRASNRSAAIRLCSAAADAVHLRSPMILAAPFPRRSVARLRLRSKLRGLTS